MHGDAAPLKKVLIEGFSDVELSGAMKSLWDFCQGKYKSLSYMYHSRRATDKCSVIDAVADDLLFAFEKLDSADSIPPIQWGMWFA